MVRSDALHIGDRCVKKGCRKGICDLCYILLGTRVPETTLHIVRDCPFTRPVITAVWRAIFLPRAQPHAHHAALAMSSDEFCTTLTRRMILGQAKYDPSPYDPARSLHVPIAALSAATNTVLVRRRNNNALNTKCPLQHDADTAIKSVFNLVRDVGTATYTAAVREENNIYTHYEGWLPPDEELPTTKWCAAWHDSGLLRVPHPSASLQFSLPPTVPGADATPAFDATDPGVISRTQQRTSC